MITRIDESPVEIFVMTANIWREDHEWPAQPTQSILAAISRVGGGRNLRCAADEDHDAYRFILAAQDDCDRS